MIQNLNGYNPLQSIKANSGGDRSKYTAVFYDFVRKELFLAGLAFETEDEFSEALVLLFNMDII